MGVTEACAFSNDHLSHENESPSKTNGGKTSPKSASIIKQKTVKKTRLEPNALTVFFLSEYKQSSVRVHTYCRQ